MKILYLSNQRLPTEKAYGYQIAKMCESFGLAGIEVNLIYPSRKNPTITDDFYTYYNVEKNFYVDEVKAPDFYLPGLLDKVAVNIKSIWSAMALSKRAEKESCDMIYSRDEWPLHFLKIKKPMIFEAHNFSLRRKFLYKKFIKNDVKIIAISESLRQEFIKLGFKQDNVLTAHDGVDLNVFDIDTSKEDARRRVALPIDKKLVLYSGHLFSWKGADILAKVAADIPNAYFVFVGGMPTEVELFQDKFARDNVSILGLKPRSEIPYYLKAADILVLPNSAKEKISSYTSPLKLFEYMAAKRPIIASNLTSIIEILNQYNAVIVYPDDKKALAEGINILLNNETMAESFGQRTYELVQQFTWFNRAVKILTFLGAYAS